MATIRVQAEDFDPAAEAAVLTDGRKDVGALVTFTGLCRDEGGLLNALELEHYPGMAERELAAIVEEAQSRWAVQGVVVIHRYGKIAPGERIVMVAVSAWHRGRSFLRRGIPDGFSEDPRAVLEAAATCRRDVGRLGRRQGSGRKSRRQVEIGWLAGARAWARSIKRDLAALWIAARDPRVPWYAKALASLVVAYALSPVDLIPDFIPVLGYLDDVILVPLGLMLAIRLIPDERMREFRLQAEREALRPPRSRLGLSIVAMIWLLASILLAWAFWPTSASSAQAARLSGFTTSAEFLIGMQGRRIASEATICHSRRASRPLPDPLSA